MWTTALFPLHFWCEQTRHYFSLKQQYQAATWTPLNLHLLSVGMPAVKCKPHTWRLPTALTHGKQIVLIPSPRVQEVVWFIFPGAPMLLGAVGNPHSWVLLDRDGAGRRIKWCIREPYLAPRKAIGATGTSYYNDRWQYKTQCSMAATWTQRATTAQEIAKVARWPHINTLPASSLLLWRTLGKQDDPRVNSSILLFLLTGPYSLLVMDWERSQSQKGNQ